jgi:K+-sensing histidine kinase KdpD
MTQWERAVPFYVRATAIVVVSLVCATLLTFPLRSISPHSLTLLFIAAVVVTSRYGGAVPGICAALVSVVIFDWYFDRNPYHLDFNLAGLVRTIVFCSVSFLVASLEHQRRRTVESLEEANRALRLAMEEIRTLHGILPICSYCKRIRTDEGSWMQIESYVRKHSHAEFTHGICPECYQKNHPEIYRKFHPPSEPA